MDISTWAVPAVVLALGALVQSAAGFGFSLMAVPLLMAAGYALPEAAVMGVIGSTVHRIVAVRHLRGNVDWPTLRPMMITGVAALPLGLCLLSTVSSFQQTLARQVIGACILLLVSVQWFGRTKPRETVPKAWGHVAAFSAGVLAGFANIGGPPIVLWILAHRWTNEKIRVTNLAFSLVFIPLQLIAWPIMFGWPAVRAGGIALAMTPLVLAGTWLGMKLGTRLGVGPLRLTVRILLLVIALAAVARPFFQG